ncbi:MAG: ABC transporter permease subunit, partial [Nitrospina sp.]|nr:ABC transporter permease subunit [Nitrospina sp.]
MDWSFFADQLLNPTDKFVRAFFLVICMSLISMFFGVILGIIFALLRLSKSILIQTFSFLYIWIFRSVPVMVWFVLFYTGFAIADIYRFQDLNLFGFIIRGNVQAA